MNVERRRAGDHLCQIDVMISIVAVSPATCCSRPGVTLGELKKKMMKKRTSRCWTSSSNPSSRDLDFLPGPLEEVVSEVCARSR